MRTELTIIVLAAGRGTRFGGPKQSTPLGPDGELLLDYTLRDAAAAGFSRAIVVVGDDVREPLRAHLREREHLPVDLVVQPAPLGTAHAVLLGAHGITSGFAVANADDWYGHDAFAKLAAFLSADVDGDAPTPRAAVIGYAAGATLSPIGGVSRAVCRVDTHGRLLAIEEVTGIRRDGDGIVSDVGALDESTPVSMNLWGFTPDALDPLRPLVDAFLADARPGGRELRLPDVVGDLVARGELAVSVIPTTAAWFGVTHPEDADIVRSRLRALAEADAAALSAAAGFATRSAPVVATPLVHGHIHDTFVVACGADRSERVVLQRLNRTVFRDLDALARNWRRITDHLERAATARGEHSRVAEPVPTRTGDLLHVDRSGAAWRMTRYVENSRVLSIDAADDERRAAARAFAELTRDLDGVGALAETIPRFHDLARRRADLTAAVAADRVARASGCVELVATTNRLADAIEGALAAGTAPSIALPVRIVHNDAKLDNVLVDITTGAVACIVDLDTVMPGSVLNDFGELVRTAATAAAEDEPDLDRVIFDPGRFATIAAGYLEGAAGSLTPVERDALALAGPLLALENGVRFLTDHLEGDVYFRVHRPEHNLQRARVQLKLAGQMLDQADDLRARILRESERVS